MDISSAVAVIDSLMSQAQTLRASDIHLDPQPGGVRVRLRVDGLLRDLQPLPLALHAELISRIKILAGLRTDEHQSAQDGRFRVSAHSAGGTFDVRVSIIPTYYGENAVLRLLADQAQNYSLETLGLSQFNQERIERALQQSRGMIVATGPTGSGKTTTLYTLIKLLATPELSLITIEDPIEYAIEDIRQIQVDQRSGLTFANGLRSIVRQDPDVVMVGEIRDTETAAIAVNTALTGHLVLSTLHTNDAAEDSTLVINHTVVVSGLDSNRNYFFRAVSHGSPETVGNEISATTTGVTPPGGGGGGGGGGGTPPAGTPPATTPPATTPPATTPTTPPAGQVLGESVIVLTEGMLVKTSDNPTVYMFNNGKLRPFTSARIFLARGLKFSDVLLISPTQLAATPMGSPMGYLTGALLKGSLPSIFYISGDLKQLIPSMAVFNKHKFSLKNIVLVKDDELASYPDGAPLQ